MRIRDAMTQSLDIGYDMCGVVELVVSNDPVLLFPEARSWEVHVLVEVDLRQ